MNKFQRVKLHDKINSQSNNSKYNRCNEIPKTDVSEIFDKLNDIVKRASSNFRYEYN